MQSSFAVSLFHLGFVVLFYLSLLLIIFLGEVVFPGAIVVAVAVVASPITAVPPKSVGQCGWPSRWIIQARDFGGDRGGEQSAAEAEQQVQGEDPGGTLRCG